MSQNFLSPVKLSGITTGSILKVDSNGVIVAAVSGTDYLTSSTASQWTTTGNDIYYNTGNVGIGESSPDGILHVKGSSQVTEFYIESSTGTSTTSGAIKIGQNNRAASSLAGEMVFSVQSSNVGGTFWREAMTILHTGWVGIGTSSPSTNFDVSGSANISGNVGIGTTSPAYKLDIDAGAGNIGAIIRSSDSVAQISFRDDATGGDANVRLGATGTDMTFFTGGAEKMRINSSGNVGIGTTSPGAKLEVYGTDAKVKINNTTSTNTNLTILDLTGNVQGSGTGNERAILLGKDGNIARQAKISYLQGSSNGQLPSLAFFTGDNDDSLDERMRISSAGNVGIGTTSPGEKLDVNGTVRIANTLRIDGFDSVGGQRAIGFGGNSLGTNPTIYSNGSYLSINSKNSSTLYLNYDSSGDVVFAGTGNVGIGTTSPSFALSVEKDVDDWVSRIYNTGSDANAQSLLVRSDATAAHDASVLGVYADSGYKVMVKSTGNVGINTASPEDKLHVLVTSTSAAQGIYLDSGGGSAGAAYLNVSTSNGPVLTGNTTPAGLARGAYKASRMQFNAGGFKFEHSAQETANASRSWSTHMVINTSGDVGIGVTSPSTKLHVNGTITASGIKTENTATVIDNSGIQPSQGEVEDIVLFKHSGTGVASIDTGGYVTATGYKTGGTTGFLKSDGTVDTNAYLSSSTLNSTVAFTINGNDVEIGDEVSMGSGLSFDDTTYTISSSDTLDSVTDRGATTTNDVTVGGLTANGDTITFLNETAGNKNINIRKRYDASSLINWIRSSNTDAYMGVDASENFQIGYASSGLSRSLIFTSNNSEVIRFDVSGNVGIGTDSPSYALDIERTTGEVAIQLQARDNSSNTAIYFGDNGDGDVGSLIYNQGSNYMSFTTNAGERMRITSDGNVGIGTTSPTPKLHLVYSGGSYSTDATSGFINQADTGRSTMRLRSIRDEAAELFFDINGGIQWDISARASSQGNELRFYRAASTPSYSGVNGHTLALKQDGTIQFPLYGAGYLKTDASGNITVDADIIEDTLDSVTDRGATTTNAISVGNLTINSSSSAASYIYLLSSTTGESELRMGDTDTDAGSIAYNNNLDRMAFRTNAAERMYIDSSGNVGIGVVPKTGGSTWQHIQFGGTGNIIGRISDSTVDAMFANNYYVNSSNVDSHIITGAATRVFLNDGEIRFDTAPSAAADAAATFTNRLFIANTGNVGIGTTSPSYTLDVNGSFNATSVNVTNDITTSAGDLVVQNGAGIYSIKSTIQTSASSVAFRIDNTNGVQAARATFVAETANYKVAKIYEVVKAGTADPVAFKVLDTGPDGEEDFSVAFSNDGGDLLCTVTNGSANESLTLVTTIFVGGSNTSQTVSNS